MDELLKVLIALFIVADRPAFVSAPAELNLMNCRSEAVYGFPIVPKQDTTRLCRRGYSLEYDNVAKIPIWAAYVLTPKEATGCFPRRSRFEQDDELRVGSRSTPKDYAKSGYDIGHQVNAADMQWDKIVEQESFLLSNAAPQLPEFNRGIWKKLEESTRGWAVNRRNPLQVYVGPIYHRELDRHIGENRVTVPRGFWKVIIDTKTRETMVFIFNHSESKADLSTFITTLPELQRRTGLVLPMPPKPRYMKKTWPRVVKSVGRTKTAICSLQP